MGTNVYANNFEISSKAASGMTAGAFPDVCFTPPPTPAGTEVPVPYPNTAKASDLTKGSTKVKICNKEAALEDSSCISTSVGNEPAKPSTMQGGVITKTTKGKAYYVKWSNDVKFEGKGVCRHIDPTTNNHGSTPGSTPPMPYMSGMTVQKACASEVKNIQSECKEVETKSRNGNDISFRAAVCKDLMLLPSKKNCEKLSGMPDGDVKYLERVNSGSDAGRAMARAAGAMAGAVDDSTCLQAMRCALQDYGETKNKGGDADKGEVTCCPGQSGHHVIPKTMAKAPCFSYGKGKPAYGHAPVVCVEGVNNTHGTHGMIHRNLKRLLGDSKETDCKQMFADAAASMANTFSNCSEECVEAQLQDAKDDEKTCDCGGEEKTFEVGPGFSGEVTGDKEGANITLKSMS